jgi:hypothetical protein
VSISEIIEKLLHNKSFESLVKKIVESEDEKECEIPKYMPCWFWGHGEEKVLSFFGYEEKEHGIIKHNYVDVNENSYQVCEPAWDQIFNILAIPKKYNWIAMDKDGQWYAYVNEPTIFERFIFHKHPDWENSKYRRPE